jgi:3D (Asp-Asp-Asp) domain-containing protein
MMWQSRYSGIVPYGLLHNHRNHKKLCFLGEDVMVMSKTTKKANKTAFLNLIEKAKTQLKTLWEQDAFYTRTVCAFVADRIARVKKVTDPFKRYAQDLSVLSIVLMMGAYVLFPTVANADAESELRFDRQTVERVVEAMLNASEPYGRLPMAQDADPRRFYTIPLTAYNSEPGQTDDTPCITASGLDVCERGVENVVAANFLPLGTRVRIPELYGDRIFYVEDRMNARYYYKMDVWLKEKAHAKAFGVKHATIEVF